MERAPDQPRARVPSCDVDSEIRTQLRANGSSAVFCSIRIPSGASSRAAYESFLNDTASQRAVMEKVRPPHLTLALSCVVPCI